MADKVIDPEVVQAQDEQPTKPVSRFTRWYRSPLFNVVVVGLISFTQPGTSSYMVAVEIGISANLFEASGTRLTVSPEATESCDYI